MANTGKIIPFGYASGGVAGLERLMQDERAMLVDIRMSPKSLHLPTFNIEVPSLFMPVQGWMVTGST